MENRVIEAGKYTFVKTTYNDISVLIEKDSGYYNATKICKDNEKRMNHLNDTKDFKDMILSVSEHAGIPAPTLIMKINEDIPHEFQDVRGTYIHPLLVNYVCQWANKAYAIKVSIMMNLINEEAKLKCSTFESQLESQSHYIDILKSKNNSLEKRLAKIETQNEELIKKVDNLTEINKEQTMKIDEQTTLIKGIRSDVHDLKTDFNDNFTVSNITTATAKYIYLILDNKYYYDKYLAKEKIESNEYVYDTVCCLKSKLNQELKYHGYKNLDEAKKDIKLKYECSCSIDISKFISNKYIPCYCRYHHRKIIFTITKAETIINDIYEYLNSTLNDKRTIVERLDELDTKMEEYRIELKEISYLAKLITGKKYSYQGRMRTLYETGKGKYFNINRERKYINEDIAKKLI